MLLDATEPFVLPVIKSGALEEMERIGRNVIEYESLTGVSQIAVTGFLGLIFAIQSKTSDVIPGARRMSLVLPLIQ
ncbi:MAG: hypothetical protein Ct9H300mP15_25480 [Gemmatimonadota bacterium]|nr:MAG: hypothetical protein Ct9H300mP15_25480 [Gemmatimonadota bacterium]